MDRMNVSFLLLCVGVVLLGDVYAANMNGKYVVASGAQQKVPFNDDYASKGYEYFDLWGPEIATQYGEVFWRDQNFQPLPANIVKRFDEKVIAIVGYEQDQVMVVPTGSPGVNPDQDVSVPINWAYNHHYMWWVTGKHAEMRQVPMVAPNNVMAHGSPLMWMAYDLPSAEARSDPSIPTSTWFSEGNGGESRLSYHGYPRGYAQLVDSPTQWHINPMQIDTRNRDCGVTIADIGKCTQFVAGPEPKQARYGRGIPGGATNISGIIECPCNSAWGGDPTIYGAETPSKKVEHMYYVTGQPTCSDVDRVADNSSCYAAAQALGIKASSFVYSTVNDATLPRGCSVALLPLGTASVVFNVYDQSTSLCSQAPARAGTASAAATKTTLTVSLQQNSGSVRFERSAAGVYCEANKVDVLGTFMMTAASDSSNELARCEAFCATTSACGACSVDCPDPASNLCRWVAIPTCGAQLTWSGLIEGDISLKAFDGLATITASGPSDVWFGFGFDAQHMMDKPWTIIMNSTGVLEHKIGTCGDEGSHCPGTPLAQSVTVVSNTVADGVRTVVMTRPFKGASDLYYTFDPSNSTINFITAIGSSESFGYHATHASGVISLLTTDNLPNCVCDAGAAGALCNATGGSCDSFIKDCSPQPYGDLLAQKNPTCNARQYAGGLRCCADGRVMLDADQANSPILLRYHMKVRIWFQEYVPAKVSWWSMVWPWSGASSQASHIDLPRIYQTTENNAGEYDVPPAFALPNLPIVGYPDWPLNTPTPGTTCTGTCPDGPDCECVHTITSHFTLPASRLIYAGGHCHAPSCISLELFRNDTGVPELICSQIPIYGTGSGAKFDEADYINIPPCLWGDDAGLLPSFLMPAGTPLISIKKNRNTINGHYGEMASWQMRGIDF